MITRESGVAPPAVDETIRWRPILPDLERAHESDEVTLGSHVVLWNKCDGMHELDCWMGWPGSVERAIEDARRGFCSHFAILKGPFA